jgi:hypothetical protein
MRGISVGEECSAYLGEAYRRLSWPNFTSADHDSLSFEGPGTEVELASHIH